MHTVLPCLVRLPYHVWSHCCDTLLWVVLEKLVQAVIAHFFPLDRLWGIRGATLELLQQFISQSVSWLQIAWKGVGEYVHALTRALPWAGVWPSASRSSRAHLQEGFVEDEGREKGQDMFDVEDSSVNRSMFELT